MQLGISASFIGWEEKRLIQAFRERGVDVLFLDDSREFYSLGRGAARLDGVLVRSQSFVRGIFMARYYSSLGIPTFNTSQQIELCSNKYFFTLELEKSGLSILPTAIAFTKTGGLEACKKIGFPVVIKPCYGGHGDLIALAETELSASGILESREVLGHNFQKAFYLQKYLPLNRDIRVIVVGKEPICAISRKGQGDWRHNTSQGGTAEYLPITDEIKKVIDQVLLIVGPGIFGVDIFEADKGLLVNEVNHVCQFKNPTEITKTDVAGAICHYVEGVVREY